MLKRHWNQSHSTYQWDELMLKEKKAGDKMDYKGTFFLFGHGSRDGMVFGSYEEDNDDRYNGKINCWDLGSPTQTTLTIKIPKYSVNHLALDPSGLYFHH